MRIITTKELSQAFELIGWVKDKYGHFQKPSITARPTQRRVRLDGIRCYVEVMVRRTPTEQDRSKVRWVEVDSAHYADIRITSACQIVVGNQTF